jgi:adenine-specific DNA-methyltransferase
MNAVYNNNGKGKPKKQRLELTWIGKDEELKLEPRILIEDPEKSYGDPNSENMLIHGDNLLALKALEQDYAGKVKCIYIDPPYNTGSAFEHYDDGVEHSIWLNLMKPRLQTLLNLLSEDGTIFISIDDNEMPYLRVLCDEIFGRKNHICTLVWQKVYSPKNQSKRISVDHEYILSYAKNEQKLDFNLLERTPEMNSRYKNPDNDPRGPWKPGDLIANEERKNGHYIVTGPHGDKFDAPPGKHWAVAQAKMIELIRDNRVVFGKNGKAIPSVKQFLTEVQQGRKASTLLMHNEVGHNDESKKEVIKVNSSDVFATPKPERLIKRIIELATAKGDIVLDSFLGSGTAAAVAHKMGRKWIGVELGEHANTHCLPRLKRVVDGTDGLPLSESLKWEGGGGFKFYNLASSLLRKDKYDNWVIDEKYNANMLAAAMCKHEGFRFSPHEELYWKQGKSTETDYIFTTTAFVTVEQLDKIHEEMSSEESLLICAKSFAPECDDRYPNITVKKIPQMILGKCEYGQDNYNLNIIESTEEIAEDQDDTSNDDE